MHRSYVCKLVTIMNYAVESHKNIQDTYKQGCNTDNFKKI